MVVGHFQDSTLLYLYKNDRWNSTIGYLSQRNCLFAWCSYYCCLQSEREVHELFLANIIRELDIKFQFSSAYHPQTNEGHKSNFGEPLKVQCRWAYQVIGHSPTSSRVCLQQLCEPVHQKNIFWSCLWKLAITYSWSNTSSTRCAYKWRCCSSWWLHPTY